MRISGHASIKDRTPRKAKRTLDPRTVSFERFQGQDNHRQCVLTFTSGSERLWEFGIRTRTSGNRGEDPNSYLSQEEDPEARLSVP